MTSCCRCPILQFWQVLKRHVLAYRGCTSTCVAEIGRRYAQGAQRASDSGSVGSLRLLLIEGLVDGQKATDPPCSAAENAQSPKTSTDTCSRHQDASALPDNHSLPWQAYLSSEEGAASLPRSALRVNLLCEYPLLYHSHPSSAQVQARAQVSAAHTAADDNNPKEDMADVESWAIGIRASSFRHRKDMAGEEPELPI
jgi:hypothetical protein